MIGPMTLAEAAIAFGGTLFYPDCRFQTVSTDTRTLADGDLFVALRGERFDGHDYLREVADRACGLVVERPDKSLDLPQWVVEDTTLALGQLARLNRKRFQGALIALTGSTGKTTVKEMLASILSLAGPTLATAGNFNNHIGVPLTLLRLAPEHRYAVVEMGASGPGEIQYLCEVALPDVGLVNNVMPAHLEGFGSEAAIAETKGAIYTNLPIEGTAVINQDAKWAAQWRRDTSAGRNISFSIKNSAADVGAAHIRELEGEGTRFELRVPGDRREVFLPLPGRHNVANALAAAACARAAGASLDDIAAGLEAVQAPRGRLQVRRGRRGSRVLDDSYNASPGSVRVAVDVLAAYSGRRILVLGDMAELGAGSETSHEEVGAYAHAQGIEALWTVGRYARFTARGFGTGARVFDSRDELAAELLDQLDAATSVLVKGSRSAAMEAVVEHITEEGNHASMAG